MEHSAVDKDALRNALSAACSRGHPSIQDPPKNTYRREAVHSVQGTIALVWPRRPQGSQGHGDEAAREQLGQLPRHSGARNEAKRLNTRWRIWTFQVVTQPSILGLQAPHSLVRPITHLSLIHAL